MKITELTLSAVDIVALYEFYAGDLSFPVVRRSKEVLTLQAGSTALTFRRSDSPVFYHFAFNVHPTRFERARAATAAITPLLQDGDGEEVFDFRSWDARACYFYDPEGNIVEIIARRDLSGAALPPDPGIISVSEIGLVAEDVPALASRITRDVGLPVYRDSSGETFAAFGDAEGLLILVQRGRVWYPDTGKPAVTAPIALVLHVGRDAWQIAGPPYRFSRTNPRPG